MRLILTILLSGNFIVLFSQAPVYGNQELLLGVVGDNSDWQKLLKKRECIEIAQYARIQSSDSIELLGRAEFTFLDNGVIQMRSLKKRNHFGKSSYWKWIKNEQAGEIGYLDECNKRGVLKSVNFDFETTNITISATDSMVDKVYWWVSKNKDTTCHFLYRWIYRQDTLVEAWYQWMTRNNCSWADQKNFEISKYTYPDSNTTITESFKGNNYKNESIGTSKTVKLLNELGQLISLKQSSLDHADSNYQSEIRYFYTEGLWSKTEYWDNDVLLEIFQKQPLTLR